MSSGGKKSKKGKGKGISLSLGEFLGTSNTNTGSTVVVNKGSWADESEDFEEDRYQGPTERLVLPTAPRTAREPDVDPERVPRDPPFTAYIANLPFEVDDNDITRFFQDLKVKSIRLPREGGEGGRFKGFGYVEFETRSELLEALGKNEDVMGNRKIRVDVAEGEGGSMRRGFSDRSGRDDDRLDRSEGVSDWRAAPPREGFRDRYGDRDRDRGFGDRDRGFGDRDRGFGDRDRDRGKVWCGVVCE
ncbi:Eukaryotic translation initiation factor 4B [Portunus trituberculatus]|uniref:Eukaryotic translation initiation factor 4B n=1 Tax=Portunus trituberculatus TaxID=210409 RepID=A0A5B7DUM5_PORTR|nr:Eukaryotic translation initiation factor 4B [Portunus trituberculatus]